MLREILFKIRKKLKTNYFLLLVFFLSFRFQFETSYFCLSHFSELQRFEIITLQSFGWEAWMLPRYLHDYQNIVLNKIAFWVGTCSAAMSADLQPWIKSGRVTSTRAGNVFLLMWPGDFGPLGADDDVANMSDVETSKRIFRHSAAIGRISLSVSDNFAIRRESSWKYKLWASAGFELGSLE